jgi:heat shock protein HtpX
MTSAYSQQNTNIQKTWFLIILFVGLVSGLFYGYGYISGNYGITIIGVVLSIGQCVVSYFAGEKLALMSAGAVQITYDDNPQIFEMVTNISKIAGIPVPKIHISPDPSPNAFACGRDPNHASMCLNQGIIDLLNKQELEGVIAHELSHVKNRDILIMTTTMVLSSIISFIADYGIRAMMWGGGRSDNNDGENNGGSNVVVMVLYVVAMMLAPVLSALITMSVSREREFLADATAIVFTRYPKGLADALLKLEGDPTPSEHYSTATNHFYISEPKQSWGAKASSLFSTHPKISERVEALMKMG